MVSRAKAGWRNGGKSRALQYVFWTRHDSSCLLSPSCQIREECETGEIDDANFSQLLIQRKLICELEWSGGGGGGGRRHFLSPGASNLAGRSVIAPSFNLGVYGDLIHHDMWILPLVGYTGVLLGFGFLTLAIGIQLAPT